MSETLVRLAHAYLLVPDGAEGELRKAVVTLNGHHGSACQFHLLRSQVFLGLGQGICGLTMERLSAPLNSSQPGVANQETL